MAWNGGAFFEGTDGVQDWQAGTLACIDQEPAGNADAEMLVQNMAEFGGNAEDIAASPGMHPAEGDASIVPVLRKDALFGAPQALGMDTSAYNEQRWRKVL